MTVRRPSPPTTTSPPRLGATARDPALDRYSDIRHMPKRTCLGCGGSLPGNYAGFSMCDGRGVEVGEYRFTWAELLRMACLRASGQMELDLP
jgi:hypothetical protein